MDDQNALDDKSEIHGQVHCLVMRKFGYGARNICFETLSLIHTKQLYWRSCCNCAINNCAATIHVEHCPTGKISPGRRLYIIDNQQKAMRYYQEQRTTSDLKTQTEHWRGSIWYKLTSLTHSAATRAHDRPKHQKFSVHLR